MKQIIDKLHDTRTLTAEEYRKLLLCKNVADNEYLRMSAQQTTLNRFGNRVFIRGLIEISNCCRNDCLYCGIRKSNKMVSRYTLSREAILSCCAIGYDLGFRTFVLQGGENESQADGWIEDVVMEIRRCYPDCAITLSLGEKSRETYQRLYDAGANRYLLRHETYNPIHYHQLHPDEMSREHRINCLKNLKKIGFQTGTGIMVGSPGQTVDHLVEDILFMQQLKPEMIGLGPFIPHTDTVFANHPAGSEEMTSKMISICRLMFPSALIPSTTALASLSVDGREKGILAGANVVMPNLSPNLVREKYALYNNKASFGAESAEGLSLLIKKLEKINYKISNDRGDYQDDCQ